MEGGRGGRGAIGGCSTREETIREALAGGTAWDQAHLCALPFQLMHASLLSFSILSMTSSFLLSCRSLPKRFAKTASCRRS